MTDIAARVRDQITAGVTMWPRHDVDALLAEIESGRDVQSYTVAENEHLRTELDRQQQRAARARAALTGESHDFGAGSRITMAITILAGIDQ